MSLPSVLALLLIAAATAITDPAPPADDAGWPCDTPARPLPAPAQYWPDVARPAAAGWAADGPIVTLARTVSRRSVAEADAVAQVRQFAKLRPGTDDRAKLAAAMIDTVDSERTTILAGIRHFNARQAQLARRIEQGYAAMDATGVPLTAERRAAIEEQATWDQRIFEDRQRMLPIVCRQPAALEGRLAALLAALKL